MIDTLAPVPTRLARDNEQFRRELSHGVVVGVAVSFVGVPITLPVLGARELFQTRTALLKSVVESF
jgi:hypothetical protein